MMGSSNPHRGPGEDESFFQAPSTLDLYPASEGYKRDVGVRVRVRGTPHRYGSRTPDGHGGHWTDGTLPDPPTESVRR